MFNIFDTYSYKRGAVISVGSTLLWKLLSFLNGILIAFYFGTHLKADVYFYILSAAGLAFMFFNSLNENVLIPQAMHLRRENEQKAQHFLNVFLYFYFFFALLIIAIGFLFPVQIFNLFSKFNADYLQKDILLLQFGFIYLSGYIMFYYLLNIMYMYRFFAVNLLLPLNAICPFAVLILFHNILGLKAMLLGFSAAFLLQSAACLFVMKRALGWQFGRLKIHNEGGLKHNMLTNQILVFANFIIGILPMYLMSGFGAGYISAYSYARQLTDGPNEILTSKITNVYSIQLNENAAAKQYGELNSNFIKATYLILFIMVPLSLFTCYFAPDIVSLFFKRGAFGEESAANTVKFLRPMMILLITTVLTPFAGSIVAAARKIKESFKYILLRDIIIIAALYFFIKKYGAFAYPYVQLGGSVFGYFILSWFFKNNIKEINFWAPLRDVFNLCALNLFALLFAVLADRFFGVENPFWNLLICGVIFLAALFAVYLPTGHIKKITRFVLGPFRYAVFLNFIPQKFKRFFI